MTIQHRSVFVRQTDPPRPARETLPTMYDLPSENPEEPGMPDQFHIWQSDLLTQTFRPPDYAPDQMLIASDLNLYYDVRHPGNYKRPDWYAVPGVPYLYEEQEPRLSYVIWQEGVVPFVVVELLSPGTEKEDLGMTLGKSDKPPTKWEVYEQILGIPYYAVFSRYTDTFRAFELVARNYREVPLPEGRLWLPHLKLGLGLWHGRHQGLERKWLRWYDADKNWFPTFAELAEQEKHRAEHEKHRAEQEKYRAEQEKYQKEKLLAQLKAMGVEPDM